jgi:hypothetical protein
VDQHNFQNPKTRWDFWNTEIKETAVFLEDNRKTAKPIQR